MPEIDPTNPNVTIERNPRAMAKPAAGRKLAVRHRSWLASNLPNGSYIVSSSKPERRGRGHAAGLDHEDWPA
jgi:hypothetical protein